MASFEKELGRWSLQETGSLAKLLASDYMSRLSPVKSISSIDHLLQFPSKVDSAYSSFSGGSTLPDYHTSPVYNANYCLPSSQVSYMDSEYVRAIYKPNVINSELGQTYPLKPVDYNRLNSSENIYNANVGGLSGGSSFFDSAGKSPSPLPLPTLPYPPSPPTRHGSYQALQTLDKPKGSSNVGPNVNQRKPRTPPGSSINSFIYTSDSKGSHLEDRWMSRLKIESQPDQEQEWDSESSETKNISSTFTKQPSFVLQESPQSISAGKTQTFTSLPNAASEYYVPGHATSKNPHPLHSNHNVNDLPESKHYFYLANFHKQTFSSTDRSGLNSECKEQAGKFPVNLHHSFSKEPSERDENVPHGVTGSQYARHALQKEPRTADGAGDWETIEHHHTKRLSDHMQYSRSEEETHKDIQEFTKTTAFRPCDPSQAGKSDSMEAGSSHRGEMEFTGKRLSGKSNQIFYCGPKAEPSVRSSSAFKTENQTNGSCPKNEEGADSASSKTQLDLQMSKYHPLCDLISEKITKEKTPMLFHLASGRHAQMAAMFNVNKQTPLQEEAVKIPKRNSQNTHVGTTEDREVKRESKPPLNTKIRPQLTDNNFSSRLGDETIPVSPGTSADDSCMNDYREQLKIAQKKVLRETSFKRRDLQMSLPIRLKVNPSKRPTIEHFKSLSLTHDHENVESTPLDGKLANDNNSKNEERKKPLVSRIGGRKRHTKEDKKLYHSEPEKLDRLGVVQDPRPLRKGDSTGMVSSELAEASLVSSRKMDFENRERARSASSLSKTELKQIQHSALLQYIERKTGQRSTSTQHIPLPKPTPAASSRRRHSEWIPHSSPQTIAPLEGSSKPVATQINPDPPCQHSTTHGASEFRTERPSSSSSGSELVASKSQLLVREANQSRTSPSSSVEYHRDAEEPFARDSRDRIKLAPPFQITPRGCTYAQLSQNSEPNINTVGSPVALAEGTDRIIPGTESVSSSRGRGKSMEEIGTSEVVRLAVLSQSSDQLHPAQGYDTSPAWNEPALVESLQLNLRPCPEKEAETVSRQTYLEDFLGIRGGDSRLSAFQRFSRTVQANEELPAANSSSSFSLPVSSRTQHSEERPESPGPILPARSPVDEDEVFLKDSSSSTKTELQSSRLHASANEPSPGREELSWLSPMRLSCLLPYDEEVQRNPEHTSGTNLPQDVTLDVNTEVSPEMVSDPSLEYAESKTHSAPSDDVRGHHSEGHLVTDLDNTSARNLRPSVGTADYTFSQGNKICCNARSSVQSECKEDATNCELIQDRLDEDLGFVERTADLPTVKLRSPEDQRCELLVQEIIAKDQSLVDILDPSPSRKTAVDLMEGLFPVDMSLLDRSGRKKATSPESYEDATEISPRPIHHLNKPQLQYPNGELPKDLDDITSKKVELAANIQTKLQHLRNERELLLSDAEQNCKQGTELEEVLKQVCKPNEYDRYMMFIGDLEKVVSLLLCLSMRLARVENARSKVNEGTDVEERNSLNERHNLLSRQREDAKDLKENLDRREKVVSGILSKYLNEQQLQDYRLFVKLKTCLLVEQKDLDEKIRFHEEQLERLQDSIPA